MGLMSFSHTSRSFSYILFFANSTSYKVYTIVCLTRIISIYHITLFCNCRCIFRYIICNSSTAKTSFIVVCHCCFFTVITFFSHFVELLFSLFSHFVELLFSLFYSLCRAFIFTVFTFLFTYLLNITLKT